MSKKKEVYKIGSLTEGKKNIIAGLLQEYDIQSAEDIQEALKDLSGGAIKQRLYVHYNINSFYITYIIQIHLMLRLNKLCVKFRGLNCYLNTSYVKVKRSPQQYQ